MKNLIHPLSLLVGFAAFGVTVRPADDGRALVNPNMGWTMHYYSNTPANYGPTLEPGDDMAWFPGCSVCYLRIPWAFLEPEEGEYNWTALDTPAQRWIAKGGQIAFRITCSESWLRFATPEWVRKAGAKGTFWNFGWGKTGGPSPDGKYWDPDFVDPVFLEKLENFLKAFAARYDGRPEVAFMDIGTYGLWGEGHTQGSSRVPQARMDIDVKKHIDLHVRLFPRTPLVISDDVSGPENTSGNYPLLDYARSKGVGWRDDSILVQAPPHSWFHADQAERYWRTLPVVLEHEHYLGSKERNAWFPDLLVKSVEDMHASYMSVHGPARQLFDENRDAIARINRRLGYRFQLREATWPDVVAVGPNGGERPFSVSWTWANAGVAPCQLDAYPCLTVKDEKNGILAVLADCTFNLKTLKVGAADAIPVTAHTFRSFLGRWRAPTFKHGEFDVYVSVGKVDGTPVYELPLPNDDGQRRYKIGRIRLVESLPPAP